MVHFAIQVASFLFLAVVGLVALVVAFWIIGLSFKAGIMTCEEMGKELAKVPTWKKTLFVVFAFVMALSMMLNYAPKR